jgi:hypothetical protein
MLEYKSKFLNLATPLFYVKGKVVPLLTLETIERVVGLLILSLNVSIRRGEWSASLPGRALPHTPPRWGKDHRFTLYR